jgi:DNA-binding HxlR family transcriptional regulator
MEKAKEMSLECSSVLKPIGDALYVIGGKWKLLVIGALRAGNVRFNEIQRAIGGISARVLSTELKELELNGLVKRVVHTQTPVVVEYQLTDYAANLDSILHSLAQWGTMHGEKVRSKR